MVELDPKKFKAEVKKAFPRGIWALAEEQDFDFMAMVGRVTNTEEGQIHLLLFPDIHKNFDLVVTDVEESQEEWLVSTTTGRWSWRQPPEEVGHRYVQQMKRDDFDV